ncbi:sentrin-specific protease 1-like [Cephus cinctus]|uniref:Sentrin-specific protease 1-like n=1 Tax=Cephus cinctus TaxID=211228 RepID=A0AAJ7CB80_CEPCN|nr:sentrin-specific protease 1-like [Cephus cinctus]
MQSLIKGWLQEREYSLITIRQRRERSATDNDEEDQAIEQWKPARSKKRKGNIYFPAEKYIDNSTVMTDQLLREELKEKIIYESEVPVKEKAQPLPPCGDLDEELNVEDSSEFIDYSSFYEDIEDRFLKQKSYPSNFPNHIKDFGGIPLNQGIFSTLLPDKYMDGELINSFFIALQEITARSSLNLLSFESYFTTKLMVGEKSIGFTNWAKKVQPAKYDVWLLPVLIDQNHWTLLVVLLTHYIMIYFDSCHHLPPKSLINRICSFIGSSRTARQAKLTNWSQWVLSAPTDMPHQMKENGNIGGNCGMHVCMWAYTIVSSSIVPFEEEHMNTARKGVARFLLDFPINKTILKRLQTKDAMFDSYGTVPEIKNIVHSINLSRHPSLNFDSTLVFAASIRVLSEIAKL